MFHYIFFFASCFWNVSILSNMAAWSATLCFKSVTLLTAETHVLYVQCMTAALLNCCISHVRPHRLCRCYCQPYRFTRSWWSSRKMMMWFQLTFVQRKKERKKERKGRGRERRKREALSPVVYILFMSVTYSTDLHFVMSETVVWCWYDCPQIVFWCFVEGKSMHVMDEIGENL